jgi:ADP-ribosylglycohydrolase
LATGDTIGKQTETLSRAAVRQWYPHGVSGFEGTPGGVIPRYRGKRYEWKIGETTDDTEQTLAVARALLARGCPEHTAIGKELLACRKSVHPGVSMWALAESGDPARIAIEGDGCGAAMRSAPIGVIYGYRRLEDLKRGTYECAIPTHGGRLAIGAAAAVAGAVSAAIDGLPTDQVLEVALAAAAAAPAIHRSLEELYSALRRSRPIDAFPDRTEIIVPLAIGLALTTESAQETALLAANLGGDADSVASIGGAIAGAMHPESVNPEWLDVVKRINGDDLAGAALALARMRTP